MNIEYPDETFKDLFKEAGILFETISIPDLIITQKK